MARRIARGFGSGKGLSASTRCVVDCGRGLTHRPQPICVIKGAGVERSPERPLPTGDEVWRLADAITPRYRALVLTAGFIGLRWGELLGLQRDDIDLNLRVVHVRRSLIEDNGTHSTR